MASLFIGLKVRGKMSKKRGLLDDAVTADAFTSFPDIFHDVDDIIKMALGVNASRKREPDQFKRRRKFFSREKRRLLRSYRTIKPSV